MLREGASEIIRSGKRASERLCETSGIADERLCFFLISATAFFWFCFQAFRGRTFSPPMDDILFTCVLVRLASAPSKDPAAQTQLLACCCLAVLGSRYAPRSSRLPRDIPRVRASMVLFSVIGANLPLVASCIVDSGTSESASKLEGMSEFPKSRSRVLPPS